MKNSKNIGFLFVIFLIIIGITVGIILYIRNKDKFNVPCRRSASAAGCLPDETFKTDRCCGNCRTVTGISDCTSGETFKNDGFICDDQTGVCTPINPNCCKIPVSSIEVWNHTKKGYNVNFHYKLYENGKTQEEIDAIPWKSLEPNRWSGEIVTFPGGTDVVFAATSSNVSDIFTTNRILEPGVSYWAHQNATLSYSIGPSVEIQPK